MYKLSLKRTILVLAVCLLGVFYSVPNFIKDAKTTLPSWWQPVNLGLDLQGGSSLLLEVDLDAALKDRMENLEDSARSALREAKIRYKSISSNEKGLRVKIDNPNARTKAHTPLRKMDEGLKITEEGDTLVVMYDEQNNPIEFEQIAVIPLENDNNLYAILLPITPMEGVGEGEGVLFAINEEMDSMEIVRDDEIINKVLTIYEKLIEEDKN